MIPSRVAGQGRPVDARTGMLPRNKVDILRVRRAMGSKTWRPAKPYGDDGWMMDNLAATQRIIVSYHGVWDGQEWLHASISNRHEGLPTYEDMALLHRAVWGETGWSYEVHAPTGSHVNIHPRALHLWGLTSGEPVLPNFAMHGSI